MRNWKPSLSVRLRKLRDPSQQNKTNTVVPDPGDLPQNLVSGQAVPPAAIRELRELIQQRYELDLDIWDSRKCGVWDKKYVEAQMVKADAILLKIERILYSWTDPNLVWSPEDSDKFQEIQYRLLKKGKRRWTVNPPWGED
jgi:hypothetical protein